MVVPPAKGATEWWPNMSSIFCLPIDAMQGTCGSINTVLSARSLLCSLLCEARRLDKRQARAFSMVLLCCGWLLLC